MLRELDLQARLQDLTDQARQEPALASQVDSSARARATSSSAHSRIAGPSSPTGAPRDAGTNPLSPDSLFVVMGMILSAPQP